MLMFMRRGSAKPRFCDSDTRAHAGAMSLPFDIFLSVVKQASIPVPDPVEVGVKVGVGVEAEAKVEVVRIGTGKWESELRCSLPCPVSF